MKRWKLPVGLLLGALACAESGGNDDDTLPPPVDDDDDDDTDPDGCGGCPEGESCRAGRCVLELPEGVLHAAAAARSTVPEYWERFEDANGNEAFDGLVDEPNPPPESGYESFDDADGDGLFDTFYLGGKTYARALGEVHDGTEAKTLLLGYNDGEETRLVALVGLDAVGYFNDESHAILEEIDPHLGLDLLLIGASHGHETIDTLGIFGQGAATTGVRLEYNALIRRRIVESIEEAAANLQPARIAYGEGNTGVAGYLYDGRDPVVFEDTMSVMDVRAAESDEPIAFFINWHCHPEMRSRGNQLSRDWVGYLRDAVEARVPGTTAVFFNGALGGQIGSNGAVVVRDGTEFRENTYEKMEALGLNLADFALSIPLEPQTDPALSFRTDSFFLPVDNTLYKLVFSLGVIPGKHVYTFDEEPIADTRGLDISKRYKVKTDVALLRLGDAQFLTFPGELNPELAVGGYDGSRTGPIQPIVASDNPNPPDLSQAPEGPYLKERMTAPYRFLLGLSMDFLGYIIPAYDFKLHPGAPYMQEPEGDHYEETNSIGPDFAPILLEHLEPMLEEEAAP